MSAMYSDVEVTTTTLKIKEDTNNHKFCAVCKKQVPAKDLVIVQQFRFTCGHCRRSCNSRESFWFHLFGHDIGGKKNKLHQCPMCLKEFTNKQSLQNHVLTHKDHLCSECPTCHLRFIDKSNFQHHVNVYHAASKDESVLSLLKQHKLRTTATPMCKTCQTKNGHRCNVCYVEVTTLERLSAHRDKCHFKCPDCQTYIVKKEDLAKHIALEHDPAKQFVCSTCRMRFVTLAQLKAHVNVHKLDNVNQVTISAGGLKCSVCKEHFKEERELKRHVENKHFFCPLCDLVFKVGNKFSKHVQISHSYWPVSCKFCKERCWKVFELRRHLRNQHNADYDVVGLGYRERSAKYDDDVAVIEDSVSNGQNSNSAVSNLSTASSSLSNNSNSTETSSSTLADDGKSDDVLPLKSFRCLYCTSMYPKVATLMSHIRNSHSKDSPYHCSICNESMWEDYVFQLHCIKHEKELSKVIIFGNVISQLPANYDLAEPDKNERSEIEGSEEAELTYGCPYCASKFTRMQHINSHVKQTHTGDAPYGCDICKQLMWELVEFETHFRRHCSTSIAPITVVANRIKLQTGGQDGECRAVASKLESLMEKILNPNTQCNIGLRQRSVYEILRDLLTVDDEALSIDCDLKLNSTEPLLVLEYCFKDLLHRISVPDSVDDSWIDQMSLSELIADMSTVLQADLVKSSS